MKKKIAAALGLLVCAVGLCSCGTKTQTLEMNVPATQVIELDGEVRFVPLSSKPTNVSGYEVIVTAPNGKTVEHNGRYFTPTEIGDYLITYNALNQDGEVFISKSTLLLVEPAQAPNVTIKHNTNGMIWNSGNTYSLPTAQVKDNVDTDLNYDLTITDEDGEELRVIDNTATPIKGGIYTLTYSATDSTGHVGTETVRVYATAKGEISSFEVEELASAFYAYGNPASGDEVCSISYNEDEKYTYGNSKGSLKFHCESAPDGIYPAISLNGGNLSNPNLSESDYDGISMRLYFEGTASLSSSGNTTFHLYIMREDGKDVVYDLKQNLEGFSTDKWLECRIDKTWLENATLRGGTEKFGKGKIGQIRLMTLIKDEGVYLDTYLDDVKYFNV